MSHRYFLHIILGLLSLSLLLACKDAGDLNIETSNSTQQAINELLAPWNSSDAPGVAVAVKLGDDIVYQAGHGLANLEHDIAIQTDTVFQVASVSKQFTAFAIFLLVSEDKLELDDDIRKYLPELQATENIIRIRHLLNHTGGLREANTLSRMAGWLEDDIRTSEQTLRLLTRQQGANFVPGEQLEYSNTGYFLLSQIVELVSGQSFHGFTQERIFKPLGMHNSQFYVNRYLPLKHSADSYYPSDAGFENAHLISENTGSSGLTTTIIDLLKWTDNFKTQTVGNRQVMSLMAERSFAGDGEASVFANGQELREYRGLQTWSHGGRTAAFRSFLLRIPEASFSVAIISNRGDFDTAKIAFAIVDIVLSKHANYHASEQAEWQAASSNQLNTYAGDYEIFPGVIFTLSTDGSALFFSSLNSSEKTELPQIGEHQFNLNPNTDISLKFNLDAEGVSSSFDYIIGLHGVIKAKRISLQDFDASSVNLQDYQGVFYSDELETQYTFKFEDKKLIATHLRLGDAEFIPYQTDTFLTSTGTLQKLAFVRNTSGQVTGLKASGPLANNVNFYKVR